MNRIYSLTDGSVIFRIKGGSVRAWSSGRFTVCRKKDFAAVDAATAAEAAGLSLAEFRKAVVDNGGVWWNNALGEVTQ